MRILGTALNQRVNRRAYLYGARVYLDILATSVLKARSLESWANQRDLRDAVFYDYWFENTTLAIALLRQAGVIRCAVARAHGFDVYDARWGALGRVPFREFKAKKSSTPCSRSPATAPIISGESSTAIGPDSIATSTRCTSPV